jgi:large subunit ribosomal protein L17
MRHLKAGYKLNRTAEHRLALYRNLTRALIQHERIITTVTKAKAVRPFVERLITLAKKGTLHARRLAIARLRDPEAVQKLFAEIGPRFADRPGGYTRIIKRHERRLGDAGPTAFLELLKAGESRNRPQRSAPAPIVTSPAPTPAESRAPEPPAAADVPATPAPQEAPEKPKES